MDAFEDILVIFPSEGDVEEGLWVAHSVRTDQVGVGHDPIEAVRELAACVRELLLEAASDDRVRVEQLAPAEVIRRISGARPLPEEAWARIKSAIGSCLIHDVDYWTPDTPEGSLEWEGDQGSYFCEINESDLCSA